MAPEQRTMPVTEPAQQAEPSIWVTDPQGAMSLLLSALHTALLVELGKALAPRQEADQ